VETPTKIINPVERKVDTLAGPESAVNQYQAQRHVVTDWGLDQLGEIGPDRFLDGLAPQIYRLLGGQRRRPRRRDQLLSLISQYL
jgi:hypothetical protein